MFRWSPPSTVHALLFPLPLWTFTSYIDSGVFALQNSSTISRTRNSSLESLCSPLENSSSGGSNELLALFECVKRLTVSNRDGTIHHQVSPGLPRSHWRRWWTCYDSAQHWICKEIRTTAEGWMDCHGLLGKLFRQSISMVLHHSHWINWQKKEDINTIIAVERLQSSHLSRNDSIRYHYDHLFHHCDRTRISHILLH